MLGISSCKRRLPIGKSSELQDIWSSLPRSNLLCRDVPAVRLSTATANQSLQGWDDTKPFLGCSINPLFVPNCRYENSTSTLSIVPSPSVVHHFPNASLCYYNTFIKTSRECLLEAFPIIHILLLSTALCALLFYSSCGSHTYCRCLHLVVLYICVYWRG